MKNQVFILIDHTNGNDLSVVFDEKKIGQDHIDAAQAEECTILRVESDTDVMRQPQVRKALVDVDEDNSDEDEDKYVIVDWELIR